MQNILVKVLVLVLWVAASVAGLCWEGGSGGGAGGPVDGTDVTSEGADAGDVLTADGADGAAFSAPAVPANLSGADRLEVRIYSTNNVTITAARLAVRGSTSSALLSDVNVTATISSSVGAGGPDASGLDTSNRWLYVWVVAQAGGASPAGLISASSTSPTMPSGYTLKALVSAVRNNGSSNFVLSHQIGPMYWIGEPGNNTSVLSSGSSSSFTDVDASAWVPPISKVAVIEVSGTNLEFHAGDKDRGLAAERYYYFGIAAGGVVRTPVDANGVFQYKAVSGSATAQVVGFYVGTGGF